MKTFMFPGQGSQSKGMGVDLFEQYEDVTAKADEILGYSIKDLCLNDPNKELDQTRFTQPALFVVNALSYYKTIEASGEKPDYVAGHSLGELNALLAAECFEFEVGLKLVQKRGELMSHATKGGMAAVINSPKELIFDLLEKGGLKNIALANYNSAKQVVISGLKEEIVKAEKLFSENDIRIIVLNTSGAFHSKYMEPAKKEFEAYLKKFEYSELKIPVISNRTAKPYKKDEIIETLSGQIISPVRWSDSVQYLMGLGDMTFQEIGHGEVLTKLVKQIKSEVSQETEQTTEQVDDEASAPQEINKVHDTADKNESSPQEPTAVDESVDEMDSVPEKTVQVVDAEYEKAFGEEQSEEVKKSEAALDSNDKEHEAKDATAEEKVGAWNKKYAIGAKVKSMLIDDVILETRTEAVVLFGMRAAVFMEGYNGYFDLDEITPYEPSSK